MQEGDLDRYSFPPGFLWGAATSAHQVEGDNRQSDWWLWEQNDVRLDALRREGKNAEDFVSGQACDHYHRFQEDFDLAGAGGHNAHRLSLEWARVEPEEGVFKKEEIAHYRGVLEALRQRGIKAFVTLWHFTNPLWFAEKGGWLKRKNVKYFIRYCKRMARDLGDVADAWTTINEPNVYAQVAYNWGNWPPQHRSFTDALKVFWHLALAHRRAYACLHRFTPKAPVGAAINAVSYVAHAPHRISTHLSAWLMHMATNHLFYLLTGRRTHDYIGVNYYFRTRLKSLSWKLSPTFVDVQAHGRETSSLGWEIYPQGLFESLVDLARYNKPVYVLENGIATDDDGQRAQFLQTHLREVYHAIREGVDVRGYFHWSLLDNFEWQEGWMPKFGLVAVDRATFMRTPKPSYYLYKKIVEGNRIQ